MIGRFVNYLRQSRVELQKVVWPSRQVTINHTVLVIAFSVGMAAFLGGIDYLFNLAIEVAVARR